MEEVTKLITAQTQTIIGLMIAGFSVLAMLMIWITNKHDAEMNRAFSRLDGHAQRIDQLYNMFCELLKERK